MKISGACGITQADIDRIEAERRADEEARKSPNHPDHTRAVRASAEAVREILGEKN